jgi:hypothetical protein
MGQRIAFSSAAVIQAEISAFAVPKNKSAIAASVMSFLANRIWSL